MEASDGEWSKAHGQSTAADADPLDRRPGACRPDEAAGLKVDSDSSMEVAGGRLLAEEVHDGPAPLRLEDATPGLAICWRSRRRPAGVPAGAGSPSGGVLFLLTPRRAGRRLIPGRSRRRRQLECVGLPDNRAVALDGVARRTPPIRRGRKVFPLATAIILVARHSGIRQQKKKQKRWLQQTTRPYSATDIRSKGKGTILSLERADHHHPIYAEE